MCAVGLACVFVSGNDLNGFNVPDLGVAILSGGDDRFVVQPHQSSDLRLWMCILDDCVLRGIRHRPNDDCRVQRTAGYQRRIW